MTEPPKEIALSFYKHKHQNKEIPPQENELICRLFGVSPKTQLQVYPLKHIIS